MPRDPRFEELGRPLHVIAQGLNRCRLFVDDHDRRRFKERANTVLREVGVRCAAWALMDNHVHFVLQPTRGRVGLAMQRVLGGHATYFNRRHERVGRLFRNRFFSRPVNDEHDIVGLVAYVLLNPLAAGVVEDVPGLAAHRWTSLHELLRPPPDGASLVDQDCALAEFGESRQTALPALIEFLDRRHAERSYGLPEATTSVALNESLQDSIGARGLLRFAASHAELTAAIADRDERAAVRIRLRDAGWNAVQVAERACELNAADLGALRTGRKTARESWARAIAAHFGVTWLGVSTTEIAGCTGVSRQAISLARCRGVALAQRAGLSHVEFFDRAPRGHPQESKLRKQLDCLRVSPSCRDAT